MTKQQREIIREAYGSLGAAIVQSLPTDDQIIMSRVREAHTLLGTLFYAPVVDDTPEVPFPNPIYEVIDHDEIR